MVNRRSFAKQISAYLPVYAEQTIRAIEIKSGMKTSGDSRSPRPRSLEAALQPRILQAALAAPPTFSRQRNLPALAVVFKFKDFGFFNCTVKRFSAIGRNEMRKVKDWTKPSRRELVAGLPLTLTSAADSRRPRSPSMWR